MKNISMIYVLILCCCLFGCAGGRYSAYVVSYAASDIKSDKEYFLIPGDKNIELDDLEFVEMSKYIHRIMTDNGYSLCKNGDQCDEVIAVSYGIGSPTTETGSYSIPQYGQTGYSGSNTYGTITNHGNGTGTYSGTTYYTPQYGITGYTTNTFTVTKYTRYLKIVSFDAKLLMHNNKLKQLWTTTVLSRGTSCDLRRIMPVMAIAAKNYIAVDSGKTVEVDLNDRNPDLKKIRGELPNK